MGSTQSSYRLSKTPDLARSSKFNIHYLSMWPDADADVRNIEYTRAILMAMKPWSTGGVYLNWIGNEGGSRVQAAFSPQKWQRLRALKKAWDPDSVLQHNQNIPRPEVAPRLAATGLTVVCPDLPATGDRTSALVSRTLLRCHYSVLLCTGTQRQ